MSLRTACTLVLSIGKFAEYTEQAKKAILARDWDRLGDLMDANFALRRETYAQLTFRNLFSIQCRRCNERISSVYQLDLATPTA